MPFDLRLAIRSLRRQPALAGAVVFTVGLAVAGNTALFSVFDGLLFRPLPYPEAERIVHIELPPDSRRMMAMDEVRAVDAALRATPLLEARGEARGAVLLEDGAAEVAAWNLRPARISAGMLRMLGVAPAAGRLLADHDATSSPQRAMIGFELWQTRFGGSPSVLGTAVDIPGVILRRKLELVGVMPRGFAFPDGANLWVAGDDSRSFNFARLAEGATTDQVRAALPRVAVTPLREHLRPGGAFALGVLLAATGCLLLVAWVQVAALLFARASHRAAEIGIRLALGANRARLVRQLAAEGAVMAFASLGLAWLITPALTSAVIHLLPEATTRGQILGPDLRTFAFSVAISLGGLLVLVLVPAEIVRHSDPVNLVKRGAFGRLTAGAPRTRLAMLGAQLAVTTMLLYMSGLAIHSFRTIASVHLGFDPDRVIAVQLPPTTAVGANRDEIRAHLARQVQQWSETLDALRALPGVTAAAGGRVPFRSSILISGGGMPVTSPGLPAKILAEYGTMTPDYVRVLRLAVLDGRVPGDDELSAGGTHVVINQAMARELAAAGAAVGQRITVNNRTATVAAVVGDFKTGRPDVPVAPAVLLLQQRPQGGYVLARLDPNMRLDEVLVAVRTTMDRIWPANPSREVMIVANLADAAIADFRARALLLGLIGILCLPLAFAGVTGALSYAVSQSSREIGIRVALGARPADIRRTIVGRGLVAAVGGLTAGLLGGVLLGRAMAAFLFGVAAADLTTIAGVSTVLLATSLAATAIPSRRAVRVDPAAALRQ